MNHSTVHINFLYVILQKKASALSTNPMMPDDGPTENAAFSLEHYAKVCADSVRERLTRDFTNICHIIISVL